MFFEKVYDVVRKIPVGRVTTYGAMQDTLVLPIVPEWLVGL